MLRDTSVGEVISDRSNRRRKRYQNGESLTRLGEVRGDGDGAVARDQLPCHIAYRGTSRIRNSLPSQDHHRALGLVLLKSPRGALSLMSEVPLHEMREVGYVEIRP